MFAFLTFLTTPIGAFVYAFFTNPLVRYLVVALAVLGVVAGADIHGRVAQHRIDIAQFNKEAADAVAQADAARAAADKKFVGGKFNNRPSVVPGRVRHGNDGFSRD
jgi:hypothetical protein